jgi:hypothetical protein
MQNDGEVVYRLNERDEICYANSAYDVFAEANSGAQVESGAVFNRSLWDFISDSTTQQLYREAVRCARAGRPVRFRFRCDSPTHRRLMEMTIVCDAGAVEFRVRTVSQESRTSQALLDSRSEHTHAFLRICGWCKKVYVDGTWMEIEEAVDRLQFFERSKLPTLTHGICDRCYDAAAASLRESGGTI